VRSFDGARETSGGHFTKQPKQCNVHHHVTVIDTENGKEVQDRSVIISGDRISEVTDSKGKKPPTGAKVVDGRGKYLIPGLWDMHVHAVFAERLDSMFPTFVANGVLGIREMGTSMPLADIDHLRHETVNGSRLGPRIVAAGPILDGRPKPLRPNFLAITTPEEGRDADFRIHVVVTVDALELPPPRSMSWSFACCFDE